MVILKQSDSVRAVLWLLVIPYSQKVREDLVMHLTQRVLSPLKSGVRSRDFYKLETKNERPKGKFPHPK